MAVSRNTKIVAALAAVAVLGVVIASSVARDQRSKVTVQTGKVGRRDLVSVVSASGEVKPRRYVNVSANVSGRITRLFVKEGDRVREGQILATIESTRFAADARQSQAALAAARSDLEHNLADMVVAQSAFERNKKMHEEKLISDQVYDQSEADLKGRAAAVESQKRRIAQLEAAFESTSDTLRQATIPAPMDGIVTSLDKEEGESVIGAQSFSPTTIMTVADLSVMEVEVMVDETDIRNVKLGEEADVRVDALEGVKVKGEVTEIGASAIPRGQTAAATTSGTNNGNQPKDFKVTVTLKDPPPSLRPGLNATADITTARRQNAIAVPIQAIVVRGVNKEGKVADPNAVQASSGGDQVKTAKIAKDEEKDGVFVVKNNKAVFKPVKTGVVGETDIEVLEGLSEGDEIVTGSYKTLRTLKDDARVKVETSKGKEKA